MILKPANAKELSRGIAHAFALGEKLEEADLRALNRVVEYTPEDMTVTVEAGITLATLQAALAKGGQWLPLDPPNPDTLTVEALLAFNASGPRRYGYGTVRDYVIGLRVVLADGRSVKSGARVVKNVAGYDLAKLFIGSQRSLGVVAEVIFKLRPLPEVEATVGTACGSLDEAGPLIEAVLDSELAPVVLDLHNGGSPAMLVLGFAGTREEVEWQVAKARGLGFRESSNLDYEQSFWGDKAPPNRASVLPSKTTEVLHRLGDIRFVARAGNGVIYYRGGPAPPRSDAPVKLTRRLKDAFDPKRILPELTS
ncbi:MAG TPA: FAD-binding oxidoreductase [Verrucomicrobiae bacterium]|nr:FAD-binding oxidoreductase [Verrucomicrobiae bacterium]